MIFAMTYNPEIADRPKLVGNRHGWNPRPIPDSKARERPGLSLLTKMCTRRYRFHAYSGRLRRRSVIVAKHNGSAWASPIIISLAISASRILLIIGGGIAAYKSLELIRRLRERGAEVRVVMTAAAQQFVSPLSAASLSGAAIRDDLFSLDDEAEMGHIE